MLKNIKTATGFLKMAVKYGAYIIVLIDVLKYASQRFDDIAKEYENDNKPEISEAS
jgi:hypothetical protein